MSARWLLIVLAVACGPAQHPASGSGGHCLSMKDIRAAVAHLEVPVTQQAKDKLATQRLMQLYDDLVTAHQAASSGLPAAPLTSGACMPETVLVHVIFMGDEKPILALASERLYPTDPSPQNGLRDVSGRFVTTHLVELAALSNVQSIDEPDRGSTTLNYTAGDIQANALRAQFPGMTGAGVTVVVLDTGIEWRHDGFKTNGKTRIKRYWDIAADPPRAGEPPARMGWASSMTTATLTMHSTECARFAARKAGSEIRVTAPR